MHCDLNVLDSIIFITQMCLHQAAAALGRAGGRGALALGRWGVRALGRAGAGGRAAGRAGARLGARCTRGTDGRQHGLAACARRLGQVGVLCTLTRFFGPVRLGIFPKSPNEHCSL